MQPDLRSQFITLLEQKYGTWNKTTSRFGATPFGTISKDLNIGASQFSKLIYGTATEGMYQRSIANIQRLIRNENLMSSLEEMQAQKTSLEKSVRKQQKKNRRLVLLMGIIAAVALVSGWMGNRWLAHNPGENTSLSQVNRHPLAPFFDQEFNANFNSPYLDISEVQNYCPASAYEGVWSLNEPYKLPLPGSKRPGLYYLGKSADVRMKVARYEEDPSLKGHVLAGYEFLVNEIWVDTEMKPLSPTYFDQERKQFTEAFEALDFEANPNFKKVATIYSFFVDRFEVFPDSIIRKGEPVGRFATDVDDQLVSQYEIDLKYILESVIGDLTTTACNAIANPFTNPNDLQEQESAISFDCTYTITNENLGIGGGYPYKKGFRLLQQNYADNLFCRDQPPSE
jgi:hypothetical protein